MKYYLHDTSAIDDEKVTELYMNFGYEGVGLFYTILEKLAKQEKPIKTIVLKKQLNVGKRLEKCWKFMESLDIISSNNGETFNKQLLNFSESYQIKKEKNRERIAKWRSNQSDTKDVTRNKSVRNSSKVKRSKVKRSNKNEKLFYPFSSDEFKKKWEEWKEYKHRQHKFTFACILSEQASLTLLKNMSKENEKLAIEIIDYIIGQGWKGFRLPEIDKEAKKESTILPNASKKTYFEVKRKPNINKT